MYYPILRGRQNELIAIRELSKHGKLNNIVPILEPVKVSSTLFSTISQLRKTGNRAAIVLNSDIGTFEYELNQSDEAREKFYDSIDGADNFLIFFKMCYRGRVGYGKTWR